MRKLREADRMLAEGIEVPEVAKALEVSEATYRRWRAQFGGMKADDVKLLKELERDPELEADRRETRSRSPSRPSSWTSPPACRPLAPSVQRGRTQRKRRTRESFDCGA